MEVQGLRKRKLVRRCIFCLESLVIEKDDDGIFVFHFADIYAFSKLNKDCQKIECENLDSVKQYVY